MEVNTKVSLSILKYFLDLPENVEISSVTMNDDGDAVFTLTGVDQYIGVEEGEWVEAHYQQYPEEGPQFIGFQPLE